MELPQLPLYQCHKKVRAARITCVGDASPSGARSLGLDLLNGYSDTVVVDAAWLTRNPKLAIGGYFVVYELSFGETVPYTAYSPAEPFVGGYTLIPDNKSASCGLNFGQAIDALKDGRRVARAGWNGKGMWLELQVPDAHSKMSLPYIYMKTADDKLVPWLASQTDVLAEDWGIVE